jgi:superoxide dismutase, Cu-Zn family
MPSRVTVAFMSLSLALAACGRSEQDAADRPPASADTVAPSAPVEAAVRDSAGSELGTVTLSEGTAGITIAGRLTGLPPGEHAIHLHLTGRCDPPAFESAGDHWNPTGARHGSEVPRGPHLGDLTNLTVAKDSSVSVNLTTPGGTLRGENALLDPDGAAVVIHAKPDDYRTQPSGASGDRIACGMVGAG